MQIPHEIRDLARSHGWEVESEAVLLCPHGHRIEWDGRCPEGCVSILRRFGLI